MTLQKLLVREMINTVRTVKKYKKEKFLDKHKLSCKQIIPISSDSKEQKLKTSVASEIRCFFQFHIVSMYFTIHSSLQKQTNPLTLEIHSSLGFSCTMLVSLVKANVNSGLKRVERTRHVSYYSVPHASHMPPGSRLAQQIPKLTLSNSLIKA